MNNDYRLMEPAPSEPLERCPCCGSSARVWEYIETPGAAVMRVVMCDHGDDIGPRYSLVYAGCLLAMPPNDFYRATGREAVRYWNEYAKALTAFRRRENWNAHRLGVLRSDQPDAATSGGETT